MLQLNTLLSRICYRAGDWLKQSAERRLLRGSLRRAGFDPDRRIVSYTSPEELAVLHTLAAGCAEGARALEIGSHLGASAVYLAAGLGQRHGHLYCVDTWNNDAMADGAGDTYADFCATTRGITNITAIRKMSTALEPGDLPLPLHLVFIDADHSYAAVKADFEHIEAWLTDDAIVAFHDTLAAKGVTRFVGEIMARPDFSPAGHVNNLTWLRKITPL
jgi:predicted O-methyltransferase YrrM